ncbi:MAG: hypothetical protein HY225_03975 [Candidatus Vogelbacteria bacterium]|nr:hypothetical protein [Candidatus Vogelbacteria bacterium]
MSFDPSVESQRDLFIYYLRAIIMTTVTVIADTDIKINNDLKMKNGGKSKKGVNGRVERGMVGKIILSCLAVGGLLTMAALAPNAIQALSIFGFGKRNYNSNRYLKTVVGKLHKRGLVSFVRDGDNKYIVLTTKGERALAEYQARNFKLDRSKEKWDGKWRVVIFDIKEESRMERNLLRNSLINIGFVKVQNSVWVFPYDCEEFIFLLKTDFEFGRDVLFLVVEKLENDKWLKKDFGLK